MFYSYPYDGLHRLTEAIRGAWNGSLTTPSVTQLRNSQEWSLDPLGNWLEVATDLDGAGGFDVDEVETRDFLDAIAGTNRVNELYARTLAADAGGDELDLTYDFAGNILRQELTNDGTDTTALRYTHDAWNRLVRVEFEDDEEDVHPRGEYEYNGLNWRTVARIDSDTTNSTHALDELRTMYYSPEWRLLEIRVDANYQSSPGINSHVQHVWGERYIDDIVSTRHDPDPSAEDGYETVQFHVTDAQFSTVAMLSSAAAVLERVTYSAYGVARHHWLSDVDGDGDADTTDVALVNAGIGKVIGDVGYRSEFDLNRDGSITLADRGLMSAASALPEGVLSSAAVGNRIGYCGYVFAPETRTYLVRHRWYLPPLGRWGQRDPAGYVDGMNLYLAFLASPVSVFDPTGLSVVESLLSSLRDANWRGCKDFEFDLGSIIDRLTGGATVDGIDNKYLRQAVSRAVKFMTFVNFKLRGQLCVDECGCVSGKLFVRVSGEIPATKWIPGVKVEIIGEGGVACKWCPRSAPRCSGVICAGVHFEASLGATVTGTVRGCLDTDKGFYATFTGTVRQGWVPGWLWRERWSGGGTWCLIGDCSGGGHLVD